MTTSWTVNRKRKKKPRKPKISAAAKLKPIIENGRVARALKKTKEEARKVVRASGTQKSKKNSIYAVPKSRRRKPLRSYAVGLSAGLPGNEESDP
jgi:hypothetical protein